MAERKKTLNAYFQASVFLCLMTNSFVQAEVAFQNTPYNTIVYENAPADISVFTAHACDADGGVCNSNEVDYFLMGDASTTFKIDRASGVLSTATDIRKEIGGAYKFYVIVTAAGLSGYSEVVVQVTQKNMFAPTFRQVTYNVYVYRNSAENTHVLAMHATDLDAADYNRKFSYYVTGGRYSTYFRIRLTSGELRLTKRLENPPEVFEVAVTVRDRGSPVRETTSIVTVHLSDISAPRGVHAINVTASSAAICWQRPWHGDVRGYNVVYDSANGTGVTMYTSRNTTEERACVKVLGVTTWDTYRVTVTGRDAWGKPGAQSEEIEFLARNDACSNHACLAGSCTLLPVYPGYKCACSDGYYGYSCEFFNACAVKPCANGGVCRNTSSNAYLCACKTGFWGDNCDKFDPCTMSPCRHGGTCQNTSSASYTCKCADGYYGTNCQSYNPCYVAVCNNGGTCDVVSEEEYTCLCRSGFYGRNCELVNPCSSSPCRHEGRCYNSSAGVYRCVCTQGYYGRQCQWYNPCVTTPCSNGGVCRNTSRGEFSCECASGYYGETCTRQNLCILTNPCNQGSCDWTGDRQYSCKCKLGWYGRTCADYNPCVTKPCKNSGSCLHYNTMEYVCQCANGYSGRDCEYLNACSSSPCLNGATCRNVSSGVFSCNCARGYYGEICRYYNPCSEAPCLNGGVCIHTEHNMYTCVCERGYSRKNCDYYNSCSSSPCMNAATCNNMTSGGFSCRCAPGYYGNACEHFDPCALVNCENGGRCMATGSGKKEFQCVCASGYYGLTCSDYNPCVSAPCASESTCVLISNTVFRCACAVGFYGPRCDKYNLCYRNPCENEARCVNTSSMAFRCECQKGYYGKTCAYFNPCVLDVCENGATCMNVSSRNYICKCPNAYYGTNCEKRNACASRPCRHFGVCVNTTDGNFRCKCSEGYYGRTCESYNPCTRTPCLNSGACSNVTNTTYTCACADARLFGSVCQDYDFCAQTPCANDGTCLLRGIRALLDTDRLKTYAVNVAGVVRNIQVENAYACYCNPGYQGFHCDDDVNECASHPCEHGATCVDRINGYSCRCVSGYTGERCQYNIDDCASSPCQHRGSCTDGIEGYTCACVPGFFGPNCAETGRCLNDTTLGRFGTFRWPTTRHSTLVNMTCPYGGVSDSSVLGVAYRRCSVVGNAVLWLEPNYGECKELGQSTSERLLLRYKRSTANPVKLTAAEVSEATGAMEDVVDYATKSPQLAKPMVSVLSNLMGVNTSVMQTSNAANRTSARLVGIVDRFTAGAAVGKTGRLDVDADKLNLRVLEVSADDVSKDGVQFSVSGTGNQPVELTLPAEEVTSSLAGEQRRRVQLAMYDNSKLFLERGESDDSGVNSRKVVSASLSDNGNGSLGQPLTYRLPITEPGKIPRCVYWDTKTSTWSTKGVSVNTTTDDYVLCQATHMTSFSVLMVKKPDHQGLEDNETALRKVLIGVYVGCALCVFCLLVTLATYIVFRQFWTQASQTKDHVSTTYDGNYTFYENVHLRADRAGNILLQLCLSMLLLNIFYVGTTLSWRLAVGACAFITAMTHYFLLATLLWILVHVYSLYEMLVKVFITFESYFMLKRCLFAWGLPLLVVCITLAVDLSRYETVDRYCLVPLQNQYVYFVTWLGFVCGIVAVIVVVFVMVVRAFLSSSQPQLDTSSIDDGRVRTIQIRAAFCVLLAAGVAWIIGVLLARDGRLVYEVVFCIANALLGFFVLLFYCLLYDRARNSWRHCCTTCHVDSPCESSTSSPASFNSSVSRATHEPSYRRNMQEVYSTNPTIAATSCTLPKYGNLTTAALPSLSQQTYNKRRKVVSIKYGRPDVRFVDSPEEDDNSVNEGVGQQQSGTDGDDNTRTML